MQKRGPLNPAAHLEMGFALLASLAVTRTGGKASMREFLHYYRPQVEDDEGEATFDDIMGILAGARRNGK